MWLLVPSWPLNVLFSFHVKKVMYTENDTWVVHLAQFSTRTICPTTVSATVRPAVDRTRTSSAQHISRENRRAVSFMENTTGLYTMDCQPIISTASESIFVMGDEGHDHNESLPTFYHNWKTAKMPHYDRSKAQLFVFNHLNNLSPSPSPQTCYGRPRNIPNAYGMTFANLPGCSTGKTHLSLLL